MLKVGVVSFRASLIHTWADHITWLSFRLRNVMAHTMVKVGNLVFTARIHAWAHHILWLIRRNKFDVSGNFLTGALFEVWNEAISTRSHTVAGGVWWDDWEAVALIKVPLESLVALFDEVAM